MARLVWQKMVVCAVVSVAASAAASLAGCGGSGESLREEGGVATADEGTRSQDTLAVEAGSGVGESAEESAGREVTAASRARASSLPEMRSKVIKNALMKMETSRGGYAALREDAIAAASGAGGYLQDESSGRDDEGLTHATLTLRVPADRFEGVMEEVSGLGEVTSSRVTTSDVSGEYVDLESRLRHLQAEEAFYLSLIGKAASVQEMISIREHLSAVQLEKEQGRMDYLDRQVEFSAITLSVDEIGEKGAEGFWGAVGGAFRSFARGMRGLALGFFYALPYLLVLLVLGVAAMLVVRRCRRGGGDSCGDARGGAE